jgi:UDP-N-acetylglucosamine 1-carboxyvinyltransferase
MSEEQDKLIVEGGQKLRGKVMISGAKNASLPLMAASLLSTEGYTTLENVPYVKDVLLLKTILEKIGAKITFSENKMVIDASNVNNSIIPEEAKEMRASILVAGPLLATLGEATIFMPGGCVIGKRPINFHLEGFQALGCKLEKIDENRIRIKVKDKLRGTRIRLSFPSVGATENLILAASLAEGTTIIENAAKEPEIVDLGQFLMSMGAKIEGLGSSCIRIKGVNRLYTATHTVIPDRVEAFTYTIASLITDGHVEVKNIILEHLDTPIKVLRDMGAEINIMHDRRTLIATRGKELKPISVQTAPYPSFPTDMQPLLMSLLLLVEGTSVITETIFEERFRYVGELRKMGANVEIKDNSAVIRGVRKLSGTEVSATDLRGGAALILAGLAAEGVTTISNVHHIKRGYEKIDEKFRRIGAKIKSI